MGEYHLPEGSITDVYKRQGVEYSKKPFKFSNTEAGFVTFKAWVLDIKEKHGKDKVIPMCIRDRFRRMTGFRRSRPSNSAGMRKRANVPSSFQ